MSADWTQISPLPKGRFDVGMRKRQWPVRRDAYAALPKEPLIITAEMATPIIHAERDATHLDSILAFAALTDHPCESLHGPGGVSAVPVPLDLAWVSPQGLPLWSCTPLMPSGETLATREYWHKRYPSHRADFGGKINAVTTAGRWREYRTPVNAQHVDRLHALAIGNREEVERLLRIVSHIGKKGSMGYGRVARWTLTPGGHTLDDVMALRSVPVAYYAGTRPPGALALNRAWTPPYWYSPWWGDCCVPEALGLVSGEGERSLSAAHVRVKGLEPPPETSDDRILRRALRQQAQAERDLSGGQNDGK